MEFFAEIWQPWSDKKKKKPAEQRALVLGSSTGLILGNSTN